MSKLVTKRIDVKRGPTKEQLEMLEKAASMPIVFDEDSPELSEEELAEFRRAAEIRRIVTSK